MDPRRLGTTDIEISPIGLGCLQFAGHGLAARVFPPPGRLTVTTVVDTALRGGITWFDSAEMYGRGGSERALTTALRELDVAPGEVRIATKWTPTGRTASSITRTIGARLASLQGYPIDLHQIHLPLGSLSSHAAQLRAMAALQRDGRIRSIGVSNFSARQMERASRVLSEQGLALASNQVQISLLKRDIETNGVLDTARRLGITLIAYSPLRTGMLTGRFHEDPAALRSLPRLRRATTGLDTKALERSRPLVEEMGAIAKAYDVSISQVALSWVVTFYGETVVAIPGASKPRQAAEAAGAMDLRLTERELTRLDELGRPA